MLRRLWLCAATAGLALFALGPPLIAAEEKAGPAEKGQAAEKEARKLDLTKPIEAELKEVPAFGKDEVGGRTRILNPGGPGVRCTPAPSNEVKAYPTLKSKRPLYGSITLDGNPYEPTAGVKYYFVLDESGLAEKAAEPGQDTKPADVEKPKAAKTKAAKTTEKKPASPAAAMAFAPGVLGRMSQQVKMTYDRLYFDANGDRDLTNDPVLEWAKDSPFEGLPGMANTRVFEELAIPIDYGPPVGKRPFAIVPRLRAFAPELAYLEFVPKAARRGTIRLGDTEYTATLNQRSLLSGRFDRPFVYLELLPTGRDSAGLVPVLSGTLGQVRLVDEQLVTISASPLGDKLTIQRYRGPSGVFEIGPGGRAITEMGVAGQFVSRTAMIPLGGATPFPPERLPRRHLLPVGDYMFSSLTAQYGRLRFSARPLQGNELAAAGQPAKPAGFGVTIREEKPFVLDFSGKPAVVRLTPPESQSFKPGNTLLIRVLMTEPNQGIAITGLWDTTKKIGERKYRTADREWTIPEYARLDPTIVIRDSQGKQLSEGKMPFG